jgi:hypothetical protein
MNRNDTAIGEIRKESLSCSSQITEKRIALESDYSYFVVSADKKRRTSKSTIYFLRLPITILFWKLLSNHRIYAFQ